VDAERRCDLEGFPVVAAAVSGPGLFVTVFFVTCGVDVAGWDGFGGAVDAVEVADACLEQGGTGKAADMVSCGDQSASETVSVGVAVELRLDAAASGRGIRLIRLGRSTWCFFCCCS